MAIENDDERAQREAAEQEALKDMPQPHPDGAYDGHVSTQDEAAQRAASLQEWLQNLPPQPNPWDGDRR